MSQWQRVGLFKRVPCDRLSRHCGGELQVMQSAVRYTDAPGLRRGMRRFNKSPDFGDATKIGNNSRTKSFHVEPLAKMATGNQALICSIDNGAINQARYRDAMEITTLRELIAGQDKNQTELARMLGLTPMQFSKSMHGKRRFTVREMDALRHELLNSDDDYPRPVLLPIVGLVSAGTWQEEGSGQILGYMPSPDKHLSGNAFVVVVEGDSMDRVAMEGDGIIVDPADLDLISGKYYVIRNDAGETTFKQYRDGPARLEPCSNNPCHKTIFPGRHGFTVVGRARKRIADL